MRNKMRKIRIIIPLTIIFFITGCNDNFLDLKPLDAISEADVWQDLNLIELYVNDRYYG